MELHSLRSSEERPARHRNWYKYDIDVAKGDESMHGAYIAATKRDAIGAARREGARMWRTGLWPTMHLVVRLRETRELVFEWRRPAARAGE